MRKRLVASLVAMNVDPVHPPAAGFLASALCRDRLAAAAVQQARQPFLHGLGVRSLANDCPCVVVNADHDKTAVAVRERAQGPADAAQVANPALELGAGVFSGVDAPLDVRPFHHRPSSAA